MARSDAEVLYEFDMLYIDLKDAVDNPDVQADKEKLTIALHQLDILEHVIMNKPRKYNPIVKK
jgi:citrate lyase beta subunit